MTNNTMIENPSNIERIVMQRVHLIRALRFAISSGALSMLVSALALWGIGRQVWVANVLQNAPPSLFDLLRFYLSAFGHTSLLVQALVVLMLASLIYIGYEIVRAVRVMQWKATSFPGASL